MRLMTRVRSRFAVVKARCSWRRSSSSTLGTRTITPHLPFPRDVAQEHGEQLVHIEAIGLAPAGAGD